MKTRSLLMACALVLTGCGPRYVWVKSDFDQATYQRDSYECERDLRMAAPSFGTGIFAEAAARDFAIRCMNMKGYTLTEVPRK